MKAIRIPLAAFCALVSFALMAEDLVIGNETVTFDSDEERTFGTLSMGRKTAGDVSTLNLLGGTTVFTGAITMNGNVKNTTSRLVIGGDADVTLGDIACNNSWSVGNEGAWLIVTNDATVSLGSYSGNKANGPVYQYAVFAGNSRTVQTAGKTIATYAGGQTYTYITAKENAYVELQNPSLNFYDTAGRDPGYLHVCDNAKVVIKGTAGLVGGKDKNGVQSNVVQVADSGTLVLDGKLTLGSGGLTSYGGILIKDNGKMFVTSAGNLVLGWNGGSSGSLVLEGNGQFISTNTVNLLRGYNRGFVHKCGCVGG